MTLTMFMKKIQPGTPVVHKTTYQEGTVTKISKDHAKALVQFEDGSKEWHEYYLLEFEKPEP